MAKSANKVSARHNSDMDKKSGESTPENNRKSNAEMLPSDRNEKTDINPRIAFLAYN